MADLILIQPVSGELPFVVPAGAIALMNMVDVPKVGVFEQELTDGLIGSAKIAAIPLHWAYSLPSAVEIVTRLKRVNPDIRVISGGYIVDLYGSKLFDVAPFDYLIVGDGELVFPDLVHSLAAGEAVSDLPNLIAYGSEGSASWTITTDKFDRLDSLEIGWFPTLSRVVGKTQGLSVPTYIYPWLEITRGCIYDCKDCLGSTANQKILSARKGPAVRSADSARESLRNVEDKGLGWVYYTSDFISIADMGWAEKVLNRRHGLTAYYECYGQPGAKQLDLLTSSFEHVVLGIFPDICQTHPDSEKPEIWRDLNSIAQSIGDRGTLLVYLTDRMKSMPAVEPGKRFSFKYYHHSKFDTLVPPSPTEPVSLLEKLKAEKKRLIRSNRVLGFVFSRIPFLYPLLWKLSERRALRIAKGNL
ncbi:hypothetical protein ACFL4G_04770 [Thermodesulfobacteriota bacterium]